MISKEKMGALERKIRTVKHKDREQERLRHLRLIWRQRNCMTMTQFMDLLTLINNLYNQRRLGLGSVPFWSLEL